MRNFNIENPAFLAEIRKNNMKNNLLTNDSFPLIFDELEENVQRCVLSDEELAVTDVTVERIETTDALHEFMLKCKNSYAALHNLHNAPKWLTEVSSNDAHFADFFANLPSLTADADLMDVLVSVKAIPIADAEALYVEYEAFRVIERTHEGMVERVQLAYDVNKLLRSILFFNGYMGHEIEALV